MRFFMRVIAVGLLGYALMLFQSNPAQGTLVYIRELWGIWAVRGFILWFLAGASVLVIASFTGFRTRLAWFFVGILPQLAYAGLSILYVFNSLWTGGNAQWGAMTTHSFGSIAILAIVFYFYQVSKGNWYDPRTDSNS